MRGHLETSLGGIHLGLITFLFTVFLLWRQTRRLTLGNYNRSMHAIPTHLPNYPQPGCRQWPWRNPHRHRRGTYTCTHTCTRAPLLLPFLTLSVRWCIAFSVRDAQPGLVESKKMIQMKLFTKQCELEFGTCHHSLHGLSHEPLQPPTHNSP